MTRVDATPIAEASVAEALPRAIVISKPSWRAPAARLGGMTKIEAQSTDGSSAAESLLQASQPPKPNAQAPAASDCAGHRGVVTQRSCAGASTNGHQYGCVTQTATVAEPLGGSHG